MATPKMPRNRYPGINPHLNSFLQSEGGGWEMFHAVTIGQLASYLEAHLLENYYVADEKSLQVSAHFSESDTLADLSRCTIPGVTVYRTAATASPAFFISPAHPPTLTFPVTTVFDEEEYLSSVVIYPIESGELPGRPVTRIELLSPANKPGGSHHANYLMKKMVHIRIGSSSATHAQRWQKERPMFME